LVVLCCPDSLYIANAGDCRALLYQKEGVRCITKDHRPGDLIEMKRITDQGGTITTKMCGGKAISRIQTSLGSYLSVSRCFGDFEMGSLIEPVPDVFCLPSLNKHQFLVLGCDGLFDVMESEEVAQITEEFLHLHKGSIERVCNRLRDVAYHRQGKDNISLMIVQPADTLT